MQLLFYRYLSLYNIKRYFNFNIFVLYTLYIILMFLTCFYNNNIEPEPETETTTKTRTKIETETQTKYENKIDVEYLLNKNKEISLENQKLKQVFSNITNENKKIKLKNEKLKKSLDASINKVNADIDNFVENWYEKNQENIDIGVIKLGFFKIDIFPDYLEKYIYKKVIKILYSYLLDTIDKKN